MLNQISIPQAPHKVATELLLGPIQEEHMLNAAAVACVLLLPFAAAATVPAATAAFRPPFFVCLRLRDPQGRTSGS
jgi:hypothetical protein